MSKLKILFAIATIFCVPSVFAQGSNCSFIQNFLTSDTKNVGTSCDINFNQTVTETQTYNVQCVDQTNNNNVYFNATSQMTSTGQTSLFCSGSIKFDCSPVFQPANQNATFTSPTDNINRFFLRVWAMQQSGNGCAQVSFSQDLKQCAAVQCGLGGGGGCEQIVGDGSGFAPLQTCGDTSPIIIDLSGKGFYLTSAANGVLFDIAATGHELQISWIASGADNAFLVLDRDHDGLILNGRELFGTVTPQPLSRHPNGFLALAEYDKPENGGNGDGIIDARDAIWPQLRLWVDANHDGISQPAELHRLDEMGVFNISLEFRELRKRDEFGNVFHFRARVNQGVNKEDDPVGRTAYDVFFVTK